MVQRDDACTKQHRRYKQTDQLITREPFRPHHDPQSRYSIFHNFTPPSAPPPASSVTPEDMATRSADPPKPRRVRSSSPPLVRQRTSEASADRLARDFPFGEKTTPRTGAL